LRVKVRALVGLKEVFGRHEFELEVPGRGSISVAELLEELAKRYPRFRELYRDPVKALEGDLNVLVDGRNVIHEEGAETRVRDGSLVVLFPPAAGG